MIRSHTFRPGCRPFPGSRQAFTLIELLVVMAIMLVLAGLVIAVAGSAQDKGSRGRAASEIAALSTAMENYKADYGIYPREVKDNGDSATDKLNAQTSTDAGDYITASKYLFKALSGVVAPGDTATKAYMTFLPGQLSTGSAAPTADTTYLLDPWGLSYGYSTIYQATQDKLAAGTATTDDLSKAGYNATFDFWSTAGYGTGGKSYAADIKAANKQYTLWVKNW